MEGWRLTTHSIKKCYTKWRHTVIYIQCRLEKLVLVEWAPLVRFPARFREKTDRQCAASLEKLHRNLNTATRRSNVFLHCFVAVLECVNTGITAAPVFFFLCVSPPPPLLDKIYYTDILSFRLLSCFFFFFLSYLGKPAWRVFGQGMCCS